MNYFMEQLPQNVLDKLNSISSKRPATVIQHILKHGFITTEELKDTYGYNHPPRAIRDVRELGIPIETYRVVGTDGRTIAAYRFGDFSTWTDTISKSSGRTALSKALKKALIEKYGSKCFIYFESMDESLLQVDHRIPYEISGEQNEKDIENFMLLSPSANRAKSWTCEHCKNWETKDVLFCVSCFWSHPEQYTHVAGKNQKRITITFTGDEISDYEHLISLVGENKAEETIKKLIFDFIDNK